jgi:hypothetical protein
LVAGTDTLNADVTQIGGVAQSATDLKDFADAGYDPATNKVQGVVLVDTVTTLTGHTAQTGDSYARIGATGSGLTTLSTAAELAKVPKSDGTATWNATALASINAEADTALADYDPPTKAELDTAAGAVTLANGAHGGAAATLQLGGAGGLTGDVTGDVTGTVAGVTPSSHTAAEVKTAIEAAGSHLTLIKAVTDAQAADGSGLSAVPWNAAWDAEVQSEVDDALVAFDCSDSATLVAGTLGDRVRKTKWAECNKMEINETTGEVTLYKDNGTTVADTGTPAVDSAAGTTTRDPLFGTT